MRPRYGDIFRFDRVLRTYFYTSNSDKLVQARLVFGRYGFQVQHYKSQHEPYDEDYSLGSVGLLTKALQQVSQDFQRRSVFFVEDTSLRIEALSEDSDYPGVSVKEWFASTSFEELKRQIEIKGTDRRAVVKSDIALRIPSLSHPIFFHGETAGIIAETPPNFEASPQYPWLTPKTFNGWFIPDGTTKRLGEMEFEESLAFDFRSKAFISLLDRLEELNAAINIGTGNYVLRNRAIDIDEVSDQLSFLSASRRDVLVIIGEKCAGKSTFSDFLSGQRPEVFCLEGSTLLRQIAAEEGATISSSLEALQFLERRHWDVVARRAVEYIERERAPLSVISGMRTTEEILTLKTAFPNARVVLIEADAQTRFERHLRRARADTDDARTFKEFVAVDEEQRKFGALRVGSEIADFVIRNDTDLLSYKRRIDDLIDSLPSGLERSSQPSELERCLRALRKVGRAATCDEISAETQALGYQVRKYNTNRALKGVPEFAARIEKRGELLRYRLTRRAPALLRLLELDAEVCFKH